MADSQQAIVMIRFGESVSQTCANALTKHQSVTANYGGQLLGIVPASNIEVYEGEWEKSKSLALLHFKSMVDAKRWEHSTPEIRQRDWLGGDVDIVMSPCKMAPGNCKSFLQLISFEKDERGQGIPCDLVKEVPALMKEHSVAQCIATTKSERLRGSWRTHLFVMNEYQSKEKFKEFGQLDTMQRIREARYGAGCTTVVGFYLQELK